MRKSVSELIRRVTAIFAASVLLTGCSVNVSIDMGSTPAQNEETQEQSAAEVLEAQEQPEAEVSDADEEVVVLYTNDVHTYIANKGKDADGNEYPLLNYASVAALKQELVDEGRNVILVDAGDFSQGTAYGAMDEGKTVVNLMNAAGYDLATFGNHEFDYGQFRLFGMMDQADFPLISCNFYNVSDGSTVVDPYKIFEFGGTKVAFVGISTPESLTKSTPTYFENEKGELLYNFYAGKDGSELYESAQRAIDEVKDEADYVIALGHLGINPESIPYTSYDLIANTTGLDAYIDGHSHTTMEKEMVKDKDGNDVLLTQTGSYFSAIGEMTLSGGNISTKLITDYEGRDESVDEMTDEWVNEVNDKLGIKIAELETPLDINDPDTGERRVRNNGTNAGDFCADAIYYYINEKAELDCDIAIINGGGIRSGAEAGDFSYLSAKTMCPYGNVMCLVEASGQDILDMLEKCCMRVGTIDEKTGAAGENGGFINVAGLKYDIDSSIPSTVQTNDKDMWLGGPTGEYRVNDVEVYNKETGTYEPLDLNKTYTVGGCDYLLRNQGNGLCMMDDTVLIQGYMSEDYLTIGDYVSDFKTNADGCPIINTENSPLKNYSGYLMDYENPYGSGRITIE